jgi:hypothetical protein
VLKTQIAGETRGGREFLAISAIPW